MTRDCTSRGTRGTIEEANLSLAAHGPTREDIEDARLSLPSWIFRRLYHTISRSTRWKRFECRHHWTAASFGAGSRFLLSMVGGIRHSSICLEAGADDSTLAVAHEADKKAVLDLDRPGITKQRGL